jgi:predicted AAA+ superfamily ATPase
MGGYPEALFSEAIKADLQRYIKSDIIDKVLLRDLPGLYGIQDIQELNKLFTILAYNTGNEISLDELSKNSGVAKNTIKRYLEYLEAAFLITILNRVDQKGKKFKRKNYFKVYLTNPSIRCALFGPTSFEHEFMGNIVETALISQIVHSRLIENLYYAKLRKGEIDLVYLTPKKMFWATEIKWSNRFFDNPQELSNFIKFAQKNKIKDLWVTTIDKKELKIVDGLAINFKEASVYCYTVGRNITSNLDIFSRSLP